MITSTAALWRARAALTALWAAFSDPAIDPKYIETALRRLRSAHAECSDGDVRAVIARVEQALVVGLHAAIRGAS